MRTTASDRCLRPRSAPPKRLRLSPKARAAAPANVQFTHQAGAVTGGGRVKDSESSPPPSPLPGPVLLRAERVARRAYAARCRCQVSCRGAHGWVCRARWAAAQTFRYARATRALLCRDCFLWPVGYREGGLARAWLHLTARAALRRKRQMILQWERKKKKHESRSRPVIQCSADDTQAQKKWPAGWSYRRHPQAINRCRTRQRHASIDTPARQDPAATCGARCHERQHRYRGKKPTAHRSTSMLDVEPWYTRATR